MAKSREQFIQVYNNTIKSADANIATGIPGTDVFFKANAVSQIAANISQDIDNLANNIFPASSAEPYIDKHGLSIGLTPRRGALPAVGTVIIDSDEVVSTAFTIDVGTQMTNNGTNTIYYVSQSTHFLVGTQFEDVNIPVSSSTLGSGNGSSVGSIMTFSTPFEGSGLSITEAITTDMNTGSDAETGSEYASRIYNFIHFPRGAGSIGDYMKWCYLGSPNVTQANYVKNEIISGSSTFVVFFPVVMGGSVDPNFYIDGNFDNAYQESAFPIDRSLPRADIDSVQDYIDSQKGINDNPHVITCSTYEIDGDIEAYVSLSTGLELDTIISFPDSSGGNLSIEQIVKREIRRAIISTPAKGSRINIDNFTYNFYIPISGIESSVLSNINNSNTYQGTYASILTGLHMQYVSGGVASYYIPVPSVQSGDILIEDEYRVAQVVYDIDVENNVEVIKEAQP